MLSLLSKSTPKITVVTITLGRDSLLKVAEDLRAQTEKDFVWLIAFDGEEAKQQIFDRLPADLPIVAHVLEKTPEGQKGYSLNRLSKLFELVKTTFIAFMDDDNRFTSNHLEVLYAPLEKGAGYVASRRVYVDDSGDMLAEEHMSTELVDTNCVGIHTNLMRQAVAFFSKGWLNKSMPCCDRHLQAYCHARGVWPVRVPYVTVKYRTSLNPDSIRGRLIVELLDGKFFAFPKED